MTPLCAGEEMGRVHKLVFCGCLFAYLGLTGHTHLLFFSPHKTQGCDFTCSLHGLYTSAGWWAKIGLNLICHYRFVSFSQTGHHITVSDCPQSWCFLQVKTTRILIGSVFTPSKHPGNGPPGAHIDLAASFTTLNRKWPKIAFNTAYKLTTGLEMSSLSGRGDVNLLQLANIPGRHRSLKLSPEVPVPTQGPLWPLLSWPPSLRPFSCLCCARSRASSNWSDFFQS